MTHWRDLGYHPLATLFPPMSEPEFQELVASIESRGFDPRHPIMLDGGQIIEGRHRHLAALRLDAAGIAVTPAFAVFTGPDPLAFVLQENLARRHLSTGQRLACAVLAAERTKLYAGLPTGDIAARFHVSRIYFYHALKLRERDPEAFELMRRGELTMAEAGRHRAASEPEQQPKAPEKHDEAVAALRQALIVADAKAGSQVCVNTYGDPESAATAFVALAALCGPGVRAWLIEAGDES